MQSGGLSPPTRGSRRRRADEHAGTGSIPAHTGKPPAASVFASRSAVYPRPHGEAASAFKPGPIAMGLSPPTRGSPHRGVRNAHRQRSIPAHTGKPLQGVPLLRSVEVYPRPHGEALPRSRSVTTQAGLSPPTRGSRLVEAPSGGPAGSIPAHTGKPAGGSRRRVREGVYPRPHGEALPVHQVRRRQRGLSPPTRGSPRWRSPTSSSLRSIPAHTGKPPTAWTRWRSSAVYPRPHGEAKPPD